jgi:tetratricopeptide (TPR) repeat protein
MTRDERPSRKRFGLWPRGVVAFAVAMLSWGASFAAECPQSYDFSVDNVDYYDPNPALQTRIRNIESNHMNQNVRSLRRGQSTASAAGDLRFVLAIVPNHSEALTLMLRMALRDRTDRLPETAPYPVECWLHRATVFSPKDANALMIYGIYLGRRDKPVEAIAALEKANELRPDDSNISYNLGLMYFDRRDYAKSREFAKKAYAAGFPLPGLKNKLIQAGQWSE